jgi:hypothetical protein
MNEYDHIIEETNSRLLAAETKARKESLKSPQFLTFAAMITVCLATIWWLLSEPQIQNTTAAQFFVLWGFMIIAMVWSILAIFAPDRHAHLFKKRT